MMQLLCNGVFLDLQAGASLSFTKTNPLFAFDKLTCERTAEFSLPATPKNDRVFGLAKVPAYSGAGMRQRFTAQLIDGTVVKDGYLYVSQYNGGVYKAIFVTGELLGLQVIKNTGNVREMVEFLDYFVWPNDYGTTVWGKTNYRRDVGPVKPSYSLNSVVARAEANLGVKVALPDIDVRVVPAKVSSLKESQSTIARTFLAEPTTATDVVISGLTQSNTKISMFFDVDTTGRAGYATPDGTYYRGRVTHLKAKAAMKITFPASWPIDWFIGYFNSAGLFTFLGDRSYAWQYSSYVEYEGDPLAGRSIDLERGDMFTIVTPEDNYEKTNNAWHFKTDTLSSGVTFSGRGDVAEEGDVVRMQDSLSDVSLIDIFKTYAAISGKALNYSDAEGVTFDDLNTSVWPVIEIDDKITKTGTLTRTFGNYGQQNTISFDTASNVPDGDRLTHTYVVRNDNIEKDVELQKVPFSEGGAGFYFYDPNKVTEADKDSIMLFGGLVGRTRVELPGNATIQQLCDTSTTLEVQVRMSLMEFEALKSKVRILMRGSLYVWTDSKWSKGSATLTLARL